jgi:hypothetical protein
MTAEGTVGAPTCFKELLKELFFSLLLENVV